MYYAAETDKWLLIFPKHKCDMRLTETDDVNEVVLKPHFNTSPKRDLSSGFHLDPVVFQPLFFLKPVAFTPHRSEVKG